MGNLGELYEYIAFVLNQEELGEVVNAKNFNMLLHVATEDFFKQEYETVLKGIQLEGTAIGTKVFYDSPLSLFVKQASLSFPFSFPSDLFATIGGTALVGGVPTPMEFLNFESFNKRTYNILGPSLKRHPVFVEIDNQYKVVPSSITSITVDYLRKQNTPFFDYCQDNSGSSDDIFYMPPGYEIRADGNLYANSTDTVPVQSNVIHFPTPSAYPYVSKSVELEYKDVDKPKIADRIIEMAAERSRELNLSQIEKQNE